MSRAAFFQVEEQWETYKAPEPLVEIRLSSAAEDVGKILRLHFGDAIHAAFLSHDRRTIFAYVSELDEGLLDAVRATEAELAPRLSLVPELQLIAHQGRAFPSERAGMDRVL